MCANRAVQYRTCWVFRNLFLFGGHIGKHEIFRQLISPVDLYGYFMGAVESIAEENSVIRFVDSVEISHEEDTSILTQEHSLNEHVSENKGKFESLIDLCSVGSLSRAVDRVIQLIPQ